MNFREKLYHEALSINIELNDIQLYQYEKYYKILLDTNKVMNLTSITDEDEIIQKHFIDSLSLVRIIDPKEIDTCIDVGTGAGFPGLPIKIAFPHIRITLLDSLNKRIRFLDHVKEETGLSDVLTLHGRAEDLARERDKRESFDLAVSRAVAPLSVLNEYCIPFIKVKGAFVSYKSVKGREEIKEAEHSLKILKSDIVQVDQFYLAGRLERLLIKIEKNDHTSRRYPRKAGLPARESL